jgi:hypothetical protein
MRKLVGYVAGASYGIGINPIAVSCLFLAITPTASCAGGDGASVDLAATVDLSAIDLAGPSFDLTAGVDFAVDGSVPYVVPSFASGVSYSGGSGPNYLAIADVNGDGNLDVIANTGTGFSAMLGDGTGALGIPKNTTTSSQNAIVSFDANGDGKADVLQVVTVSGNNAVSYFTSNGDGTFTAATTYFNCNTGCTVYPQRLAIGDVNGDGRTDAVVHFDNVGGTGTSVASLLGTSTGAFQIGSVAPASSVVNDSAFQLAIADLDADHKPDLVAATTGSAWWLKGDGMGAFSGATKVVTSTGLNDPLWSAGAGDFHGLGINNMLVGGSPVRISTVLFGGTITTSNVTTGGVVTWMATGDFNGDGRADAVFSFTSAQQLTVVSWPPNASYMTTMLPVTGSPGGVAIGDLNGDGKPDVVIALLNSVVVYLNTTP